jgi:hypothetical protein
MSAQFVETLAPPAHATGGLARLLRRRGFLVVVCIVIVFLVPSEGYIGSARSAFLVASAVGSREFQLGSWEAQALGQKARDLVTRPGSELSQQQQHDLVITYFDAIGRIGELNAEIARIHADPKQQNPTAAAAPLQQELDTLRAAQARRRPSVEYIIEQQTTAVLAEKGLTTVSKVLPPVQFQFTESPSTLIISPRDRISVESNKYVDPTLPVAGMEQIESQVEKALNRSALIEGTGGFSAYPTMVVETDDLEWVLNTVAHEWLHTYMFFSPLGWHYGDSGNTRTMNETVASIVGEEVGQRTLERFYPEKVPPADWPRPLSMSPKQPAKPQFEFGKFMHDTRLKVDQMLAAGQIPQAEAFMEAQRQELIKHGYYLRKLNQAYFAFHGSYAVGTSATDPIGGKLRALRRQTGNLANFVHTVARMTTLGQLDAALGNGS